MAKYMLCFIKLSSTVIYNISGVKSNFVLFHFIDLIYTNITMNYKNLIVTYIRYFLYLASGRGKCLLKIR